MTGSFYKGHNLDNISSIVPTQVPKHIVNRHWECQKAGSVTLCLYTFKKIVWIAQKVLLFSLLHMI